MREAANGPMSPKRVRLIAIAVEIAALVHPNSVSRGTIKTPGVARMPAVTRRTRNVTPATTQA
jgi:hypothetical protein